jgi:hypothetical protein
MKPSFRYLPVRWALVLAMLGLATVDGWLRIFYAQEPVALPPLAQSSHDEAIENTVELAVA